MLLCDYFVGQNCLFINKLNVKKRLIFKKILTIKKEDYKIFPLIF